jgi:hypothetical protein
MRFTRYAIAVVVSDDAAENSPGFSLHGYARRLLFDAIKEVGFRYVEGSYETLSFITLQTVHSLFVDVVDGNLASLPFHAIPIPPALILWRAADVGETTCTKCRGEGRCLRGCPNGMVRSDHWHLPRHIRLWRKRK